MLHLKRRRKSNSLRDSVNLTLDLEKKIQSENVDKEIPDGITGSSSSSASGTLTHGINTPRKVKTPRTPRAVIYGQIKNNRIDDFLSVLKTESISLVEYIRRNQRTVLHWLAYYDCGEMLSQLLHQYPAANLNITDSNGQTPLHLAARRGNNSCIKILLEYGANWDIQDTARQTAFQIASDKTSRDLLFGLYDANFPDRTFSLYPDNNSAVASSSPMQDKSKYYCLLQQVSQRGDAAETILAHYDAGKPDLFSVLFKEKFDFQLPLPTRSLAEYIQERKVNSENVGLYYRIQAGLFEQLAQGNHRFQDALIWCGFRASMQQEIHSDEQSDSPLEKIVNKILKAEVDKDEKFNVIDGIYIANFAHGIVNFYSHLEVLKIVSASFQRLDELGRLRGLFLIKELILQDTNNSEIKKPEFIQEWKDFSAKVKAGFQQLYKTSFKLLAELYKLKNNFYLTQSSPEDLGGEYIFGFEFAQLGRNKDQDKNLVLNLCHDIKSIYSIYFMSLSPSELMQKAWAKDNKQEICPNVFKMTDLFNKLSKMVAYDIIYSSNIKMRVKRICFYLDVATSLIYDDPLPDYNGAHAILSGLNVNPVIRLKETWIAVDDQVGYKQKREDLEHIFSPSKNFKTLRELQTKPSIPFLGLITRDLTFAEDGNISDNVAQALGSIHLDVINARINLLSRRIINPKTDLLKRLERLSVHTDETLYERSRLVEEQIMVLNDSTARPDFIVYLQYRLEANLGLKVRRGDSVLENKKALHSILSWLKKNIGAQIGGNADVDGLSVGLEEVECKTILALCSEMLDEKKIDINLLLEQLISGPNTPRLPSASVIHRGDTSTTIPRQSTPRSSSVVDSDRIKLVTHDLGKLSLIEMDGSASSSSSGLYFDANSPGCTPRHKKKSFLSGRLNVSADQSEDFILPELPQISSSPKKKDLKSP
jgi:hypothetical protein